MELEQAAAVCLATLKSPKSCAFPVELMVMNSITFVFGYGADTTVPPLNTPLVELEQALIPPLAALKSPKSIAFPVDEILMY